MSSRRGRALSKEDSHARENSPSGDPKNVVSIEELCTCGFHKDPHSHHRKKAAKRQALPFQGESEFHEKYPAYGTKDMVDSRGQRVTADDNGAITKHPYGTARNPFESMYQADFIPKEIARAEVKKSSGAKRQQLPFQGESEATAKYRAFSPEQRLDARLGAFNNNNKRTAPYDPDGINRFQSTAQGDYTPKESNRASAPSKSNGQKRQHLPFTGIAESQEKYREWSRDEVANSRGQSMKNENARTQPWDDDMKRGAKTEYQKNFVPKEAERAPAGAKRSGGAKRTTLPFTGESTMHHDYSAKRMDPDAYRLARKNEEEMRSRSTQPWINDPSKYDESTFRHDFTFHECPAGKLLRETPPPPGMRDRIAEGRTEMLYDQSAKEWY